MARLRTLVLPVAGAVAAVAWFRQVVLPARPVDAGALVPRRIPDPDARPDPEGSGVLIVVNPSSGPAWSSSPAEELRRALPAARVHELEPDDELAQVFADEGLVAIGAAGGDGTLAAVATIAADRDLPFVVVPAGTLNHLAGDLGLDSASDAVEAMRAGTVVHMDLGVAGDRCFVNTLSFGGYSHVVDARERLERRIGKWPALLVALLLELPKMEPLQVKLDGRRMRVWIAWVGNCRYDPAGFGPSWRGQLDDGLLDIRIVNGDRRFSRTRFVVDVLSGRLRHCPVYEERSAASLSVRSLGGPLRLAADGETYTGPSELDITKRPRALRVAVPPYVSDADADADADADGDGDGDGAEAPAGLRRFLPNTNARATSAATPAAVTHGPAAS